MLKVHKRNIYIVLLIIFIILTFFLIVKFYIDGEFSFIKAKEKIERNYPLEYFDKIFLDGRANINIKQGEENKIKIVASPNTIDKLDFYIKNETLKIFYNQRENALFFWSYGEINIYITTKDIESIELFGEGKITSSYLESGNIKLKITGNGKAILNIDSEKYTTELMGNSDVLMIGKADQQEVNITGNANWDGEKLKGECGKFIIEGNGKIIANVSKILVGGINGNGKIEYLNNPEITESIIGNGSITNFELEK